MDKRKIKKAVSLFLEGIGENIHRKDILTTPERVASMCEEIFAGINKNAEEEVEVFRSGKYEDVVLLRGISLYSICEHHLLPFFGVVHIAYIPKNRRITGLSKLVRVVNIFARRLQVQERLTQQIADTLMKRLKPAGVLVVIEAEHLCMSMRGIQKPGVCVLTTAEGGQFKKNKKKKEEVLSLLRC